MNFCEDFKIYTMDRKIQGRKAEQRACEFLQQRGLILIETNYRCRYGEIDLVMRDGQQLVFVEVRYRGSSAFGGPVESIDHRKQAKLIATASHYLLSKRQLNDARFDIVGITKSYRINWIANAIELDQESFG